MDLDSITQCKILVVDQQQLHFIPKHTLRTAVIITFSLPIYFLNLPRNHNCVATNKIPQ